MYVGNKKSDLLICRQFGILSGLASEMWKSTGLYWGAGCRVEYRNTNNQYGDVRVSTEKYGSVRTTEIYGSVQRYTGR